MSDVHEMSDVREISDVHEMSDVHDTRFVWLSGLWLQKLSEMSCMNLHGKAKSKI